MRKTGTIAEVCAAFAADRDYPERTGRGNVYHYRDLEGRIIFSYGGHFPIARLTDLKIAGSPLVLFTTQDYSITTSGHKGAVRGAFFGYSRGRHVSAPKVTPRIIYVRNVRAFSAKEHADNVVDLLARSSAASIRSMRARTSYTRDHRAASARHLLRDALDYARRVGVSVETAQYADAVPVLTVPPPHVTAPPPRASAPPEARRALNTLLLYADICEKQGIAPAWDRWRTHLDTLARHLGGTVPPGGPDAAPVPQHAGD